MISVTNNTRKFIEEENGEILIYGAGNAGYWVGHFLDICGIEYTAYVDGNAKIPLELYNSHHIYSIHKLKDYSQKHIRLIVTPNNYKEILADLLWYDHMWNLDIICLIPQYTDMIYKSDKYNINKLLSYFRRRQIKTDIPTIISNTCMAGKLYDILDMPLMSPTINVLIGGTDYIRFCTNIQYYMEKDIRIVGRERALMLNGSYESYLIGMVEDVKIAFAHLHSDEGVDERWNLMKKRINWSNLIFVLEERGNRCSIRNDVAMDFFEKVNGKKLFVHGLNFYESISQMPLFIVNNAVEGYREPALENYFDVIEWINKPY